MSELSVESTCYALTHQRSSPCDDSEHPCPLELVKQTKSPMSVEHIHSGAGGKRMNVDVHAYPVLDRQGNVSQLIEYSLDITDRKRTEQALRAMERVRILGETAGAAAHEINQPLQAISTIASVLLRKAPRDNPERRALEEIVEQASRIAEIVSNMENVQRYVTTPYMGSVDIVDLNQSSRKSEDEGS
jgi:signal transduction histidine kinase